MLEHVGQNFMDRYKGYIYTQLLWKTPSILMAHLVIAMKYLKNPTSNAWELKVNGLKVMIEVKA